MIWQLKLQRAVPVTRSVWWLDYRPDKRGFSVRITVGTRDFPLMHGVRTGSHAHAALSSGYGGLFVRGKLDGAWTWSLCTFRGLCAESNLCASYVCISWCAGCRHFLCFHVLPFRWDIQMSNDLIRKWMVLSFRLSNCLRNWRTSGQISIKFTPKGMFLKFLYSATITWRTCDPY